MYHESKNMLVKHLVNRLRDIQTNSAMFRMTIEEIARILLSEALYNYTASPKEIDTWIGKLNVDTIDEKSLVFVPILRAGEPMLNGILKSLPNARSGFLAMKRDEQTAQSKLFYDNIPDLVGKTVVLLDPMIATAGSLIDGISYIKQKNPKNIISLNIIAAKYGIDLVAKSHSDVEIFIAQIDPELDVNKYIRPGLGDAGDRAFHTHG